MKILTVFNLEVLLTAWDQRNPCAVSRRKKKTVVNDRAGIKMLSSKQELKISNLFLWGSVGLEGKMNDERMISLTPAVHKLDEVSSWCLADCLKYVRESQWRRVNLVSHVGWSFLLLGSEVRDRTGLSCSKAFMEEVEWHEIFSLVENMSSGPKQSKYSCARQ